MIIKLTFDFAYVDGVSTEMLGQETVPGERILSYTQRFLQICRTHLARVKKANEESTKTQ